MRSSTNHDPAAGSWFIEDLTSELARAGWDMFRAIEAQGGVARALESGFIATNVEGVRMARAEALADGAAPVLGVSVFPDPGQAPLELDRVDRAAFARPAPDTRQPGPDNHCPVLAPVRMSETAELVALDLEA